MARGGSEFCRIIVILLPAFYCSWTAFQSTLRATSSWSTAPWSSAKIVPINDTPAFFDGRRQRLERVSVAEGDYDCFRWNSGEWVAGPRLGNSPGYYYSQERRISDFFAEEALPTAEAFERILQQQSLCGKESPFSSLLVTEQEEDQLQIRRWTTRLLFLAVHLHQHGPALSEARQRNNSPCQQLTRDSGIGSFDFECPKSKFLVVSFYKNGIGANMRLAAVPALMAGLATGRIVLFVNNAPTGPAFLQEPWMLASCERRDAQCFFLPASPCTITHDELASAYQLKRGEMRGTFRRGEIPEERVNDRVLILHLSFRPQRQPENLRAVLYNLSQTVVERVVASDSRLAPILHKAAEAILNEEEQPSNTFNYYGANSAIFHSLLLYAMRPNPRSTMRMDEILAEILPPDFAADNSLGLPIRASDKCGVESECLTFQQHVEAAKSLWTTENHNRHDNERLMNIVVTSESRQILRELQDYAARMSNYSSAKPSSDSDASRARFVTNHRDIAQDTGYLEDVIGPRSNDSKSQITADEAMMSAISSLKAQLQTRMTLGNCCSNFHLLLKDLLDEGCGSAVASSFQCLQDHEDEAFRVCCAWDKSPRCQARREVQQHNQTVTLALTER